MKNWIRNHLLFGSGKKGYFARLLLSSLLILAVPVVVMGLIWYESGKRSEMRQALSEEQHHMDIMSQDVENLISSLEKRMIYLEYGKIYQNYQMDRTPSTTLDVLGEMNDIQSMSNSVISVYFYDRNREWIYSTSGQAKALEEFQDTNWLELLKDQVSVQHLPVRTNVDDSAENFYYGSRKVFSLVSDGNRNAYFVINLDMQKVTEELYRKYVSDTRGLYLTDERGTILWGCGEEKEYLETDTFPEFADKTGAEFWWNQEKCLYYAHQIAYENIYCVEKIPYQLIYGNVRRFVLIIFSVILVITLSTVIMTTLNVRRLYEPIGNLYRNLEEKKDEQMSSGDEIAVITRTVRELNQSQKHHVQEIARQREQLQSELLRLMLNSMITQTDFLKETLLDDSEALHYRFMVCRMGSGQPSEDAERSREHLREVLNTYLSAREKGIFTEYRYGVYAALYQDDGADEASTAEVMYQALKNLNKEKIYYSISACFRLSDPMLTIFCQVNERSWTQKFFDIEKPRTNTDREEIGITNYEACLIRDILLGNSAGIEEQIKNLHTDFLRLQDRERVLEMAQRILVTVDRECHTKDEADAVNEMAMSLKDCETLADLMNILREEFQTACASVRENSSNENAYYTQACAYIQKNYHLNMNVSDVADHLGISYAYLSKIFKEQSSGGEKLLDYLNRIRIEKAKQLLADTSLSLTEIAEQVGYNNTQSLQRFFKKYENVTPGDYRKMQGKK